MPRDLEWSSSAAGFWDQVAGEYAALYRDPWSLLENAQVVARLRNLHVQRPAHVLDLGCGTALGADLLGEALGAVSYTGVDISREMLELSRLRYPTARFVEADMTELPKELLSGAFDIVSAFFCTASYAQSLEQLLQSMMAATRPGGYLYASMLSRWSARRLLKMRLGATEYYGTRKANVNDSTSLPRAQTYSISRIRDLYRRANLEIVSIGGVGALSGVIEKPTLFPLSTLVGRVAPGLSHSIDIIARKGR